MISSFTSFSLAVLLACTLVRADVNPATPATANAGSTCTINWSGDSNSTTNWANMAIELMTGDNFNMVFLTTVATGQDGTKDGSFSWTCPQVNPFSAIYFYQFVSPLETSNPIWTTRFAIASSTGATTPPPNATQPDGEQIPWGTGVLVGTTASAPPSFASGITTGSIPASSKSSSSSSSSGTSSVTSSTTSKSSSTASPTTTIVGGGNTSGAAGNPVTSTVTPSPTSGSGASDGAATPTANSNSGLALVGVEGRVWGAAVVVMVSAMGVSMFL